MRLRPPDRSTFRALIAEGQQALAAAPHPQRARLDAEALLLLVLKRAAPERNRAWLIAHANSHATPAINTELRALIQRRRAGEPIQYITGETEFYGLPLRVTPDVLIPRPETEHLVEKVLLLARDLCAPSIPRPLRDGWESEPAIVRGFPRILDVGTGSGAIAVALAHHLPHAAVSATDFSAEALNLARQNANRNGVAIRFLHGDLLAPFVGEQFDIIASNPPYVPTIDRPTLSVEVRDHEPALALFAGPDGLDIYRRLVPQAFNCLVPGGFIASEIGYGQAPAVEAMLALSGFHQIEFTPDLQGIQRVVSAQRPSRS